MKDLWGTSLGAPRDSWVAVLEELSDWLAESTGRNSDLRSDGRSSGHDCRATWLVEDDVVEAQLTEPWQGMSLVTQVVVRLQADEVRLRVRLRAHSERASAVPEQPPIPSLLERLHARVGLSDGPIDCFTVAETVKLEMVDEFIDALSDDRRRLPVVVVSPSSRNAESFIDPDRLAEAVAFRAHVRTLDHAKTAWTLSDRVGRTLSTFDGGVRVYWPGFSLGDRPTRHRLWLRQQVERAGFLDEVRVEVESGMLASILDTQPVLRARANGGRVKSSGSSAPDAAHADCEGLAGSLLAENDELARKLKSSERRLATAESRNLGDVVSTVLDAVEAAAAEEHPEVVFLRDAYDSARQSGYQQPERVLGALRSVAEAAERYANNRLDGGFLQFFRAAGFQYASSVSDTAAGKWRREYERTYLGEKVTLGPHLRLGSLRIYWWVDEESRTLVVGHVGKHLTDTGTG